MPGKKVDTRNKAFTLIELLLTIVIIGIIGLAIFQSVNYGMQVLQRAHSRTNVQAMTIMRQMSRDLRSAFLMSNKHPDISFTGTNTSVKFVCGVSLDHDFKKTGGSDLKEKRYYLRPEEESSSLTLMVSSKEIGGRDPLPEEKVLSSLVASWELGYFDGQGWAPTWNSSVSLPESVRITMRFRGDDRRNPIKEYLTVVMIPGT